MLLCLLGGEPSPTSLHLPLENPKKNAILLRPICRKQPRSNAVRETAPFCYGRFFPRHVPKKQRHFVTADLLEATSQAMLSEKQRHFVTVVSFQGMYPKNSAILLRPICWKQPHKQCCYVHNLVNSLFPTPPLITNLGQAILNQNPRENPRARTLEPDPYNQPARSTRTLEPEP